MIGPSTDLLPIFHEIALVFYILYIHLPLVGQFVHKAIGKYLLMRAKQMEQLDTIFDLMNRGRKENL